MVNPLSCRRPAKMLRLVSSAILAVVPVTLTCTAQNSGSPSPGSPPSQVHIKWVQTRNVPANSGKQMFAAYCAPCHGGSARGDGPAVPALKLVPSDLATISVRNEGKFPWAHLETVLSDSSNLSSKEAGRMPCWGAAFRDLDKYDPGLAALRVRNLLSYLQTMQVAETRMGAH